MKKRGVVVVVLALVIFWGAQMVSAMPKVAEINEPIESSNYVIGEARIITDDELVQESSTEVAVDSGNNLMNRIVSVLNDNWELLLILLLVLLLYRVLNNKSVSHS